MLTKMSVGSRLERIISSLSDERKNLWWIYCVCLDLDIFEFKHVFFFP